MLMVDIWNTADYIDFRWFTIARDNYKCYLISWVFLIEPLLLEGHIFPLLHWGYFYFVLTSDRCSILDTFTNRQSWSHSKYVFNKSCVLHPKSITSPNVCTILCMTACCLWFFTAYPPCISFNTHLALHALQGWLDQQFFTDCWGHFSCCDFALCELNIANGINKQKNKELQWISHASICSWLPHF